MASMNPFDYIVKEEDMAFFSDVEPVQTPSGLDKEASDLSEENAIGDLEPNEFHVKLAMLVRRSNETGMTKQAAERLSGDIDTYEDLMNLIAASSADEPGGVTKTAAQYLSSIGESDELSDESAGLLVDAFMVDVANHGWEKNAGVGSFLGKFLRRNADKLGKGYSFLGRKILSGSKAISRAREIPFGAKRLSKRVSRGEHLSAELGRKEEQLKNEIAGMHINEPKRFRRAAALRRVQKKRIRYAGQAEKAGNKLKKLRAKRGADYIVEGETPKVKPFVSKSNIKAQEGTVGAEMPTGSSAAPPPKIKPSGTVKAKAKTEAPSKDVSNVPNPPKPTRQPRLTTQHPVVSRQAHTTGPQPRVERQAPAPKEPQPNVGQKASQKRRKNPKKDTEKPPKANAAEPNMNAGEPTFTGGLPPQRGRATGPTAEQYAKAQKAQKAQDATKNPPLTADKPVSQKLVDEWSGEAADKKPFYTKQNIDVSKVDGPPKPGETKKKIVRESEIEKAKKTETPTNTEKAPPQTPSTENKLETAGYGDIWGKWQKDGWGALSAAEKRKVYAAGAGAFVGQRIVMDKPII